MTKAQQIKKFAKAQGLTVKACRTSQIVSICSKIVWNGQRHTGWAECFDNYDQLYDYLLTCSQEGTCPWRAA